MPNTDCTEEAYKKAKIVIDTKLTSEKKAKIISKEVEKNKELVNFQEPNGNTLLHYAAIKEEKQVFQMLIYYGADISKENRDHKTPKDLIMFLPDADDYLNNRQQTPIWDIIQTDVNSKSRKNAVDENIFNVIYP